MSERIKTAIEYGDISENSEYDDAKNEQAFIEGHIVELENKINSSSNFFKPSAVSNVSFTSAMGTPLFLHIN